MRILSLDIGKKRVGVAVSFTQIISREYTTLSHDDTHKLLQEIEKIVHRERIEKVIVGLPKSMDGKDSEYTKYVRQLAQKIQDRIDIDVILEDERLTTQEAKRQLINLGASSEEIEERVDQYAAKLILEQYLQNY
jgi:putative Holliday junction resolvase